MLQKTFLRSDILSPLRYPGGKGLLTRFFVDLINRNNLNGCKYYEPFAGGAGVALGLLSKGFVSEVFLNDADYHIYSFWKGVTESNARFIKKLNSAPVNIKEWDKQKRIYNNPGEHDVFEVGFSTFFLNRCNRSGIIAGAGPIGGYGQKGKWRLDARFNKISLSRRISFLGEMASRINVSNMDAVDFLKTGLPLGSKRREVLVYCDPPYISAGDKLYLNFYEENDHKKLARYLLRQKKLNWIVSYDDNALIRELYLWQEKWLISLGYSLQSVQKGKELLIAPDGVTVPEPVNGVSKKWHLIEKINFHDKSREVLT